MDLFDFDTSRSTIGFSVRHLMVSTVRGRFTHWHGTLERDPADPTRSRVSVEIATASLDTGQHDRDEAVRSADFLDVVRFPKITFRSTAIARQGEAGFRVTGELTVRAVTRPVVLEVQGPRGSGDRLAYSARATISRKDFGLSFGPVLEAGGMTVGDKVELRLEVEAVRR